MNFIRGVINYLIIHNFVISTQLFNTNIRILLPKDCFSDVLAIYTNLYMNICKRS